MPPSLQPATPVDHPNRYRDPRALVCATALVLANGRASEHMTYDLSAGGVRLCGVPHAQVGDEVWVRLELARGRVRARGRLLRLGSADAQPDFAIQFVDLAARDEDSIQDAVLEALSNPDRRSILLVQREEEPGWTPCFDWLAPVSPICATAITELGVVQCLQEHRIEIGILGVGGDWARDSERNAAHSAVSWRMIDYGCRHHPVATTFGLRVV